MAHNMEGELGNIDTQKDKTKVKWKVGNGLPTT